MAKHFEKQGYELIHMSAPNKELYQPGYTGPSYLDQIVELVATAVSKNIILDRSHYGELIWPNIYGRDPLLDDEAIEIIREIEESVGARRILMNDLDAEAHWARCVANKEPLTRPQFLRARTMFERMADKYKFEKHTLPGFLGQEVLIAQVPVVQEPSKATTTQTIVSGNSTTASIMTTNKVTTEFSKLEKANAINDVLSKRILKTKGSMYDELENDVRLYLKNKLSEIFGEENNETLSNDEVQLLKLFCKRLKEKESKQ